MKLNENLFKGIDIEALNSKILNAKNIVINAHKSPDGDAVGSTLGWWNILKDIGKSATVILPDVFPSNLSWMEGAEKVIFYDSHIEQANELIQQADLIFCLDYNDFSRTGEMKSVLEGATGFKVMIDHHPNPSQQFDILISDTSECATAQMIFQVAAKLGWENKINKAAAECLYCGIMTDTGSFRFPSTSSRTHQIIASLIEKGVSNAYVHGNVFDNDSEDRLRLLGYAISSKMKVLPDLKTAYFTLTDEELKKYNFQPGYTEGFVNYGLAINGIQMAAIFIEKGKLIKTSFRSKGKLPVNEFSGKYFNGGGHMNAAGGAFEGSLEEAEKLFLEKLPEFIQNHFKN